jgi:hypothetical protein
MKRVVFARTATVVVLVALLPAGQLGRASAQNPEVRLGETMRADAGRVTGTVVNHDNTPVPNARLRLRDVTSGQTVQITEGDQAGRFTFLGVPPARYVVELVDRRNNVLALGPLFSLGRLETATTVVRLAASSSWYSGFFSSVALAVIATAATLGLTAVGNGGQPASGRS